MTNAAAATNAIPIARRLNIEYFLWSRMPHSPSLAFVIQYRAKASPSAQVMRTFTAL
jgi:hypothetical protein